MQIILNWIHAHPAWSLLIAYNAVGCLPTPTDKSAQWYRYLFAFGHSMITNIPRLLATRFGFGQMVTNADQK